MLLYYDPETRKPLYTVAGDLDNAPAGAWIEIDPADAPDRFGAYDVVDGILVEIGMAPLREEVDAERDRRIRAGITFNGIRFQTRDEDMTNIMGAATAALAAITEGAQSGDLRWADPDTDFAWIAEDNSLVPMDAQTMMAFAQAVRSHKQAHIFAAKALKDSDPIPADYAADSWWPA